MLLYSSAVGNPVPLLAHADGCTAFISFSIAGPTAHKPSPLSVGRNTTHQLRQRAPPPQRRTVRLDSASRLCRAVDLRHVTCDKAMRDSRRKIPSTAACVTRSSGLEHQRRCAAAPSWLMQRSASPSHALQAALLHAPLDVVRTLARHVLLHQRLGDRCKLVTPSLRNRVGRGAGSKRRAGWRHTRERQVEREK